MEKFKVTLDVNGKRQTVEGSTILSALDKLKLPEVVKTRGLITVSKGQLKSQRTFNVLALKLLLESKIRKEVMAKTLGIFLK